MILSKLTATEAENNKKMIGSKKIKLFTHDIFQMNKKDDKSRAPKLDNNKPLLRNYMSTTYNYKLVMHWLKNV